MKNNEKRKYIKRKVNEAVIGNVNDITVNYYDDKLYEIHLLIAEKLGDLEKIEREVEVIKEEAERLTYKRNQAMDDAEKRSRELGRSIKKDPEVNL